MELALAAKLIALAVFLLLAALVSAGQASLFHLNRARLRNLVDQGADRAEAVLHVLESPGASFGMISALYTISLAGAAAATVLSGLELRFSGTLGPVLLPVGVLLLALLLQVLARAVAIAMPESTALR